MTSQSSSSSSASASAKWGEQQSGERRSPQHHRRVPSQTGNLPAFPHPGRRVAGPCATHSF